MPYSWIILQAVLTKYSQIKVIDEKTKEISKSKILTPSALNVKLTCWREALSQLLMVMKSLCDLLSVSMPLIL
jgi:hypothetical protein